MRPRRMWLAMQFLTRLPTPSAADLPPGELSASAAWFPFVGLIVGALVALVVAWVSPEHPVMAAALGVLVWIWSTGALHLDGLADLADALAAAHRDPQRFLAALRDPHVGTFGVTALVLLVLVKFAALAEMGDAAPSRLETLASLPIIAAWARLGPLVWSWWLTPFTQGQGERFARGVMPRSIALWTIALLAGSVLVAPVLCVAPLAIAGWGLWLRRRLGGFSGDCLGAGLEVLEALLLVACTLIPVSGLA